MASKVLETFAAAGDALIADPILILIIVLLIAKIAGVF
jgi:hypothetical protein